jgi:hypothetical protein
MRLSYAGIVTTFHIATVYEKRQDLAQQRCEVGSAPG